MMMKPPMIKKVEKPSIIKKSVEEEEIKPFIIPKREISIEKPVEEEVKPFSIPRRVSIDKSDEEIKPFAIPKRASAARREIN